jgi:RNA polymerase sigma factor (sigma-70 family)
VRALQRREAWAWERLHRAALEPVFRYLVLRVRRREDAEDLTAEVFAAAVAAIDSFRGDATLLTWLLGIARRKLADARRRELRRPELLAAELASVWDPSAERASGPSEPALPLSVAERRAPARSEAGGLSASAREPGGGVDNNPATEAELGRALEERRAGTCACSGVLDAAPAHR